MKRSCHRSAKTSRRAALSLIEVIASTLLVGILFVGSMRAVQNTIAVRATVNEEVVARELLSELLSEAMFLPYADPNQGTFILGVESGESNTTRVNFDDFDDFDSWIDKPPQTKTGAAITGYSGWLLTGTVNYWNANSNSSSISNTGLKRIRLRATSPGGTQYDLFAFRNPQGDPDPDGSTFISSITVVVTPQGGRQVRGSMNLLNRVVLGDPAP